MYGSDNPSLVPNVLTALREGNLVTLVDSLDADDREDFVIAVPPGSDLPVTTHTLIRYGASQAILTVGDGDGIFLAMHSHDNEADAVECHGWKADQLRDLAAAAHAAANGPAGRAFMALKESGALDAMLKQINGDQ